MVVLRNVKEQGETSDRPVFFTMQALRRESSSTFTPTTDRSSPSPILLSPLDLNSHNPDPNEQSPLLSSTTYRTRPWKHQFASMTALLITILIVTVSLLLQHSSSSSGHSHNNASPNTSTNGREGHTSECSEYGHCKTCTVSPSWTSSTNCRWCPLPYDNRCHAYGSLANPCSTTQQITESTQCALTFPARPLGSSSSTDQKKTPPSPQNPPPPSKKRPPPKAK